MGKLWPYSQTWPYGIFLNLSDGLFSTAVSGSCSLAVTTHVFLIAVVSPVAGAHGLWEAQAQQLQHMGSAVVAHGLRAPWQVESSQTRD